MKIKFTNLSLQSRKEKNHEILQKLMRKLHIFMLLLIQNENQQLRTYSAVIRNSLLTKVFQVVRLPSINED